MRGDPTTMLFKDSWWKCNIFPYGSLVEVGGDLAKKVFPHRFPVELEGDLTKM